ncbi:Hypothetical predicted protein, partial [Paramuricea clavata]
KTPVGELFSPAYDCSKILDHNPEAKDGIYWIHLGGIYPKQAYCDMITDGRGYMLFGRTNTSVTWTVPSSNDAVEPYGNPHWASHLGDVPILDLRIQMARTEDLSKPLTHWSFRLQTERLLKNLMIVDHGCAQATPGIGNIAYVKDLQTENIVTTKFRCSVFGSYHNPATGFGWSMMNSCLKKPCRRGFAFFDHNVIKFQTDHSGSFSYSVSGSISGIYQNSTAFVGCDKTKCCGCFGPAGGTNDYCGTNCKKRRNGTILKNVYSWFWVRSSIPKKVWNKCMDYKVTTPNGDTVRYKLLDGNPTPEKGRCGRKEALLNDGIVVVPDEETSKKVPAVPGLLKYRKDTKELYVRANDSWCVVPQEKKILEKTSGMVVPKLKSIEEKLQKQNRT